MQSRVDDAFAKDASLWSAFKKGDSNAYLTIYDAHYHTLFLYGLKFCNDALLTNDCIQELFLELWKNREIISPVKKIKSYLLVYLKRKILAERRKRLLYTRGEFHDFENLQGWSHEEELIRQEQSQEQRVALQHAISRLTDRQKEVLHLKFYESLSYEEIAELTGLKIGRVYNIMHEAVRALKKSLLLWVLFLIP